MLRQGFKKLNNFKNICIKDISYFKSGINNINLYEPVDINELRELCIFYKSINSKPFIIGATSNMLFLDDARIENVVTTKKLTNLHIDFENQIAVVESGVMLPKLVREVCKNGFTGFEGLEGIPGTVGGAIYMNAGAYGYTISDNLLYVDSIDFDGNKKRFQKDELNFSFRHSKFKEMKNYIIVSATFSLIKNEVLDCNEKIKNYSIHRRSILEYKLPNLGSTFATMDIYSELSKYSIGYKVLLFFMRTFIHRLMRAKDNRILNIVTFKYFKIKSPIDIVSIKTMNTVVNNGYETGIVLEYINEIQRITKNNLKLEIEIIGNK